MRQLRNRQVKLLEASSQGMRLTQRIRLTRQIPLTQPTQLIPLNLQTAVRSNSLVASRLLDG